MTRSDQELANPTGNRLKFLQRTADTGGALLEVEATCRPHSTESPEHFHPNQEEHFVVASGEMRTVIDGKERVYGPGESFTIPAGTPHSMHNVAGEPACVLWQTRPALSTETFFETVWRLESDGRTTRSGDLNLLQAAVIAQAYDDVFRPTNPPRPITAGAGGCAGSYRATTGLRSQI